MSLTITRRAKARITAHGLNVYPLEGFGVILGEAAVGEPHVVAALPVGNTERWYEPDGRFARVEEAVMIAEATFARRRLRPLGLYCSVYESFGDYPERLLAAAPRLPRTPWLVLRAVDGGDTIFGCWAQRWNPPGWQDEPLAVVSPRVVVPERNPRRISSAWRRAWGAIDYGNRHETELRRLGFIDPLP